MSVENAVAQLLELASRARRLPPPSNSNPALFHESRDELGRDIEAIARQLCPGVTRSSVAATRAPEHQRLPRHGGRIHDRAGRQIAVAVRRRRSRAA